jgi:hypothetical protein
MSTPVPADQEVRAWPATARPYLLGGLAALSVGAAAIHFAVVFEHFAEYTLYGVFFLVISWAQLIWPAVLLWRPSLADRPVARRGAVASAAALVAGPVVVIAATTAVMTPGWAGPEGPAGVASGSMSSSSSSSQASAPCTSWAAITRAARGSAAG